MRNYYSAFLLILTACALNGNLPENILDYRLVKLIDGPEAKQFVDRIHINRVATDNNEIGFYEDGNQQSIIYITSYPSAEIADEEWDKMTKKISPENSVFVMGRILSYQDRPVYRCFGMGQTHFVFSHKSLLIWVSTETTGADDFLSAYLDYLY